jgi:hypothetical protein
MYTCIRCTALLKGTENFCDACGSFIITDIECESHPNRAAFGICVVCGRPVCVECQNSVDGKIICSNQEHHAIILEEEVLCRPQSEFEADCILRNLAFGHISAKTFSLHDHITTHSLNETRVLVFVKKTEREKAMALLQELHLIGVD